MSKSIIPTSTTVKDLANLLEDHRVLFVQQDGLLVGSVTNGDFRRGIAAGVTLNDSVVRLMNAAPVTIHQTDDYKTRLEKMKRLPEGLRYLAVTNDRGEVLQIVSDKALMTLPNVAILMAGGLGSRLSSLTSNTPKPMLRIGGKPILQLIIEQFRRAGISRFLISLNYKPEVIRDYFGDGARFDVEIAYIQETNRMGTAGCLSLLPEVPHEPFFVMNGDILSDLDPYAMLQHHEASKAAVTVCLYPYKLTVPYGVVQCRDGRIEAIEEKPNTVHNVNAGIYLLNPECHGLVPRGQMFDMTSLLERALDRRMPVGAYSLPGFWINIGNLDDFQRASHEYTDQMGGRS